MPQRYTPLLALLAAAAVLPCAAAAGDKTYRWVDEQGRVHYSDSLPAGASRHRREVLNEEGVVVKTLEGAKTAEERAEQRRRQARRERRAQRDRMLRRTYASDDELIRDRAEIFESLSTQIGIIRDRIRESEARLEQLTGRAERHRERDERVPSPLRRQIRAERRSLETNRTALERMKDELDRERERFREDLARYRELTGSRAETAAAE